MQEKAEFQRLHKTYRSAWRQFVMAVEWWQSQKPDDVAAQEFALVIEQAERLYRESRNELANYMISNASKSLSNAARFQPRAEAFGVAGASLATGHGSSLPTA